jgi:bifunctional oligoribonuclease and PAP phosphatase NrnA
MFNQIYDVRNNKFKEIWKELKKSKKVLLTLHARPDGDSFGSCTAMKYVLEKRGINVRLISKDRLSENLESYSFSKEVEFGVDIEKLDLSEFDCILFLDFGALNEFSEEFIEKLKGRKVIDMDHHATNSYYGNLNYINPNLPSCCSILFEFFDKIKFKFDRELSLRLLVGICTDTAFFIHGNSIDSLKKAIILLEKGNIDYKKDLVTPILSSPWKLKKLHGLLLTNMEQKEINGKNVAYSWATKKEYGKLGLNVSDIRLGIVCMQDIKDLDLIFTLTELDGEIKGSFRSKGLDTTIYSTVFGGGGHKEASAFSLKTTNMKKAIEDVLKVIREKGFVEI